MTTVRAQQLLAIVRRGRSAGDPELKPALVGVASEIKSRLSAGSKESHDFFVAVSESIQEIRGKAHAKLRADVLTDCCQYFYLSGTPPLALLPARENLRLRQIAGDRSELRRALSTLGILCADTGNFGEAIEHYANALQIARALGDDIGEAATWMNLSVALLYISRFHEALACLEQADNKAPPTRDGEALLKKVAHNRSICLFSLGDFHGARKASEVALTAQEPRDCSGLISRLAYEHHYVEALLELDDDQLARARLSMASQYAARANTVRASNYLKLIEGLVESSCGNSERGIETLEALVASASVRECPPLAQDALRALARAYERAGRVREALTCLQEILRISRLQREASALTRIALARGARSSDLQAKVDLAELDKRHANLRARLAESELVQAQVEVLERLAVTADLREEESGEHGYRVGRLAGLLARESGSPPRECQALELATRLHDIGKIGIPDRILLSSGTLQQSERNLMTAHAAIGAELLSKSNLGQLRMAEEIARCHHEWWDGTGYPAGLKGTRIPVHARIVALADVFDALTHGRTYEKPWTKDAAIAHIASLRGKQFEPELTDRFLALIGKLMAEHPDLDQFLGRGSRSSGVLQARDRIRSMLEGAQSAPPARQFDLATSKS